MNLQKLKELKPQETFNYFYPNLKAYPLEILDWDAFTLTHYGVFLNELSSPDVVSVKYIVDVLREYIYQNIYKVPFTEPSNARVLRYRLRIHYLKHNRYLPGIQRAFSPRPDLRLGMLLKLNDLSKIGYTREVKKVNEATTPKTLNEWLLSGKLCFVEKTSKAAATVVNDFGFEELIINKEHGFSGVMRPRTGYNNIPFILHSPEAQDAANKFKARCAWLVALAPIIHASIGTKHILLGVEKTRDESKTWEVKVNMTNTHNKSSEVAQMRIRVSSLFDTEAARHLRVKKKPLIVIASENKFVVDGVDVPARQGEFKTLFIQIGVVLSLNTMKRITLTPTSTITMAFLSPVGFSDAYTLAILNKREQVLLNYAKSGTIYNMGIIAGKAEGKSTLINLLKDKFGTGLFVEDSDDYGMFLTYLTTKYECALDKIPDYDADSMHRDVAEFYGDIDHIRDTHPSAMNVFALMVVQQYIASQTRVLSANQMFEAVTKDVSVKEQVKAFIVNINNDKVYNQRNFENGIRLFMKEQGIPFKISFLHCEFDTRPREYFDEVIRFQGGSDPFYTILARARTKGYDLPKTAADCILQVAYHESSQHTLRVATTKQLCDYLGINPFLSVHGVITS